MLHAVWSVKDAGDGAVRDESGERGDIGGEGAVSGDFGRNGTNGVAGFLGERAGSQRGEQVDALAGAEQFDSKNVAEIVEHGLETARTAHAHGHVILLIA